MMAARNEEAALRRAQTIAVATELCKAWAYWSLYGDWGDKAGRRPHPTGYHGGPERRYRPPAQWDYPEPKRPEADENIGLNVQKAYVKLPEKPFRTILRAEFHHRPFFIATKEGEVEYFLARRARVSIRAYPITLERALLMLANVMRQQNNWPTA